ncbi:hypothetical protein Tco_0172439, partial [Tanacetum coccineum]
MSGEIELEETANPNDTHPLLHHNVTASSNEIDIENDDVEAGSIVTCRICLECDGDEVVLDCWPFKFMSLFANLKKAYLAPLRRAEMKSLDAPLLLQTWFADEE